MWFPGKKKIEKNVGTDNSRIFAREILRFFLNEHIIFLPSKRVTIASGIGIFLLHLSAEELSHFLTTPLVRYISLLHTGYYNLTILGHILFHEALQSL